MEKIKNNLIARKNRRIDFGGYKCYVLFEELFLRATDIKMNYYAQKNLSAKQKKGQEKTRL